MKDFIQLLKRYGKDNNVKIYIVGGYIRDKLIDARKEPKDLDIIIEKNINQLIDYLKNEGYKIFTVKEELNIYRAFKEELEADITLLKGNNIEEDLKKRDFTINAIALELRENKIIDLFDGRRHLKSNIIQQVNEESIKDDPVRILRAARFMITYGMHLNLSAEQAVREESKNLLSAPKERLFNEFMKCMESDKNGSVFSILDNMMALKHIFPDIENLKVIGRCKYHLVDAFTHMNATYGTFRELLNSRIDIGVDFKQYLDKKISLYRYEDFLAVAAFVHDIGKSQCCKKEGEKVSFIGHDEAGAEICESIFKILGFPKEAVSLIKNVVKGHMYPLGLYKNHIKNLKSSCFKFFNRYKEYVPYILLISYCDMYSINVYSGRYNETEEYKEFIVTLFKEYEKFNSFYNRKFLRGEEIKKLLKLEGKEVGEAIDYLHKKFYVENVDNLEEITAQLKEKFLKN